jgi:hypothetical protein
MNTPKYTTRRPWNAKLAAIVRALRWFTLGTVAGAILALVLWASLYISPWRQDLYLQADPKVVAVKEKLALFRHQLQQNEMRLREPADSLVAWQEGQARLWKEYKVWRTRLGEMAQAHARTSPAGFATWSQSLLVFVLPGALLVSLGCGLLALFAVWRVQEKEPTFKPAPRRALEPEAKGEALDQFQEAVRRIADIQARSPVRQKAQVKSTQGVIPEPKVEPRPEPNFAPKAEPKPTPAPELESSRLNPNDTAYLDVLSGWEDMAQTARDIPPEPLNAVAQAKPHAAPEGERLTMQDEDATLPAVDNPYVFSQSFDEIDEPLAEDRMGRMPETTEFEKFDRQKEDVVKLTRKGLTSSEISRRLKMSQDQVELIIRMRRERGGQV